MSEREADDGSDQLLGRHCSALSARLEQAPFGSAQAHLGQRRGIKVFPECSRGNPVREDLLDAESQLLSKPRDCQPNRFLLASLEPALQKELPKRLVASAERTEEDLQGSFQLRGWWVSPPGNPGQLLHEGKPALLDRPDPNG